MGSWGNVFRSIGSVGNEVQGAQEGLQDLQQKLTQNKLKNLMDQLNIQKTQQQIKQGETDPIQRQVAAMEQILGRKLTDQEKLTFLNLVRPQQKAPDTPFAAWRTQNPDAPISDWLKLEKPEKPAVENTPFEMWRAQNPNASVAEWLKLEQSAKPKKQTAASPALDQLVIGLSSGQIIKWPTGKLLAQVLTRAKEMNVDLPKQNSGPDNSAKVVAAAQKEYQAELDKYNRWNSDHYMMRHFEDNPYKQSLSEKMDRLKVLKTGAGTVPSVGNPAGSDLSDLGAKPVTQ